MATATIANRLIYEMAQAGINYSSDTFKIALMATGFTFNKDTHHNWADVSASELSAGNGYTAGGNTLAGVSLTEDDTNDLTSVTWNSTSWTASGGSIGPTPGAMIYDDTNASDALVAYIDFGADQTATSGNVIGVNNLEIDLTNAT